MGDPKESSVFKVGDQILDAWGNEAEEDHDGDADYTTWDGKRLKAEIDRRNEDRAEEDKIVLDDKKKATAAAALAADDEEHADEDDDEE